MPTRPRDSENIPSDKIDKIDKIWAVCSDFVPSSERKYFL